MSIIFMTVFFDVIATEIYVSAFRVEALVYCMTAYVLHHHKLLRIAG